MQCIEFFIQNPQALFAYLPMQSEQIRIDCQSNNYRKKTKLSSHLIMYLYDIALKQSFVYRGGPTLLPRLLVQIQILHKNCSVNLSSNQPNIPLIEHLHYLKCVSGPHVHDNRPGQTQTQVPDPITTSTQINKPSLFLVQTIMY